MSDQILEKYDIAISYLSRDEELAYAIYTELGQVFKIFIYTQHQKELAGGNGVELLRNIFTERTNLIVILHREGWGKSEWTKTEELDIQEFGLKNRWEGILLVNLDDSKKPKWFPGPLFSLDFPKYGFQELIGVIKSRAQERGSEIKSVTAVEKAKILEMRREFANRKEQFLHSEDGANEASKEVRKLFEEIEKICAEINSGTVRFEFNKKNDCNYYLKGYRNVKNLGSIALQVIVQWSSYTSTLDHSKLIVAKVDLGRTIGGLRIDKEEPRIEELFFDFDVTPSMENRWRDNRNEKLYTSSELADDIVKIIIDFKSS